MKVISLAGSPRQPSRSSALLALSEQWLSARGVEVVSYSLQDFAAEDLLFANFSSPQLKELVAQLETADGLLIATPVYKASFSGALKTLLDLLPERALEHKVVLPLATAGSTGHMLAIDYALKPVLSALKAQEVLQGVFAHDKLVGQYQSFPAELEEELQARLDDSLETFLAALGHRHSLAIARAKRQHAHA
ncbi:NADPH-dependent FMN reductase [Rouxiella badensis]|jgi:FMN reductase|uniref:NAD(P)H-dependent FMN reductase n=1 Tax=Rouxiella badensis TaxID=1646377 RepID=A0A1X0WC20_9GAMM|nr:NADPH-dependent FMN reductase [Rouxiella badensis]MCC3701149.1 NADPH-dependent FMN reductase [Rouxiella badensis]MCC3717576.1 NADPH-dependent FMN reductase [Rouxiella badensis]MCC3727480.1 NADPH-dependent FMN reductase [Rouxiella badensis]MCC3732575.1 NADPH-dependent FMN reductase [Rouxiella badensis]MCC3740312.1 NADPH-dependent FMN reductase [Rouxiella badensis]